MPRSKANNSPAPKPIAQAVSQPNKAAYPSFRDMFQGLAEKYNGIPVDRVSSAFSRTMFGSNLTSTPFTQNTRVKKINSLPNNLGKDEIAEMLLSPDGSEQGLRAVAESLVWTTYPFRKVVSLYQDLLTYKNYVAPAYLDEEDAKSKDMWRDYKIVQKLVDEFRIKDFAHEAVGQCGRQGKAFYHARYSIDKAHGKINHAFIQQLPQDWCKIVGLNNVSKYTVAFNMMYFLQPGASYAQFGDLFEPYIEQFFKSVTLAPKDSITKIIYASKQKDKIDLTKVNASSYGSPDAYYENAQWFYWVTLPASSVWTVEICDADRNVISPFSGTFLSFAQLSAYRQVQLEIVQNPLVAVLTGEIPYQDNASANSGEDAYKLSPTGIGYFQNVWYSLLAQNNTSGVGLFLAPADNIKLQQLSEAPGGADIATKALQDSIAEMGLSSLVSTSVESRAGIAQNSFKIESQFAKVVYSCVERMMNYIIKDLNLRYDFKFKMFGSLSEDADTLKNAKEGMTLGILPSTLEYLALTDKSIFDDLSISFALAESGILDKRLPLVSTYSAKQSESGIPPKPSGEAGRPPSEDIGSSDGHEADVDDDL